MDKRTLVIVKECMERELAIRWFHVRDYAEVQGKLHEKGPTGSLQFQPPEHLLYKIRMEQARDAEVLNAAKDLGLELSLHHAEYHKQWINGLFTQSIC